jgi:hypothetical protein
VQLPQQRPLQLLLAHELALAVAAAALGLQQGLLLRLVSGSSSSQVARMMKRMLMMMPAGLMMTMSSSSSVVLLRVLAGLGEQVVPQLLSVLLAVGRSCHPRHLRRCSNSRSMRTGGCC